MSAPKSAPGTPGSVPPPGARASERAPHIAVVGAGVFGGWAALMLARGGARVTLVEAWGPGHGRASSGGDTRILRQAYADRRIYVELAGRARQLWEQYGAQWGLPLFRRTGLVWLVGDDEVYERASLDTLTACGVACERWTPDELAARHPEFALDDVRWVLHEPGAGVLLARRGCEAVWRAAGEEGIERRLAWARPDLPAADVRDGECTGLALSDGTRLTADAYVLAGGPWLRELLADDLRADDLRADDGPGGSLLAITRQEVFSFGVPAGPVGRAHTDLPVWAAHGGRFLYGIPDNAGRGFKLADDTRGVAFEPTHGDRAPSAAALARARADLARRFPALADAPLLESRTCQYSDTPTGDLIADRHPRAPNLWVLGGGSGHGFKHGPALGEHLAARVLKQLQGGECAPASFPFPRAASPAG